MRDKWIAALRSGKYKQATGRLKRTWLDSDESAAGYCCLGVACDVSELGHWEGDWYLINGRSMGHNLMPQVQDRFNLSLHEEAVCIDMNDNGKSFKEIADYLEGC